MTGTLSTIASLERQLDATPADWTLRLVLADAYEEAGQDDWARYYRWTAEHHKAPEFNTSRAEGNKNKWDWWPLVDQNRGYTYTSRCCIGSLLAEVFAHRHEYRRMVEKALKSNLEKVHYRSEGMPPTEEKDW